jgi:hypothetical protein
VLGGGGDGEEGVREHGEDGPPVPGGPGADLVLVEGGQALGGLEVSSIRHLVPATRTSAASGTGPGCPAAVEGELAGAGVAADQQPVLAGAGFVDVDQCPRVPAEPFRPVPGGSRSGAKQGKGECRIPVNKGRVGNDGELRA